MGAVELETDVHSISTEEEMRWNLESHGREKGRAKESCEAQHGAGRGQGPAKESKLETGREENWGSLEPGGKAVMGESRYEPNDDGIEK